jgi:hypothetical protein
LKKMLWLITLVTDADFLTVRVERNFTCTLTNQFLELMELSVVLFQWNIEEEINMRNLDQVKTARADIQIFPDIKNVAWNEIHRLDEMVAAGRKAAQKMLPQILKFIKTKTELKPGSRDSINESLFQACRKFYKRV